MPTAEDIPSNASSREEKTLNQSPLHNSGSTPSDASKASSDSTPSTSSTPRNRKIQIAVVGSGPSGCFVASALSKQHPSIHIDIFERLPVPFGLCRYGVCPDHPDIKNVQKQFMPLFKSGKVTWIGNITVGKEVPLSVLLQHYAAVVFASGADRSGRLHVPGSELDGVLTASDVVSNYNTLPFPYGSPRFSPVCFERARNVSIIGNGNVALDIARFLSMPYQHFGGTDMNCYTIRELLQNQIRTVNVVARSSAPYSSFTIASFRELAQINPQQVQVNVDPFDLSKATQVLVSPTTNARVHRRLMELLHSFSPVENTPKSIGVDSATSRIAEKTETREQTAKAAEPREKLSSSALEQKPALFPVSTLENGEPDVQDAMAQLHQCLLNGSDATKTSKRKDLTPAKRGEGGTPPPRGPCKIFFRYNLTVERFLPQPNGEGFRSNRLGGILFRYTSGGDVHLAPNNGMTRSTNAEEGCSEARDSTSSGTRTSIASPSFFLLPCDTVIQSIGYQSDIKNMVSELPTDSTSGRIQNKKGRVKGMSRVYCSGWAKTGSKGVIVHSLNDANETARTIIEDIKNEVIPTQSTKETTMEGKFGLLDYFIAKQLEPVSISGVERILHVEKERGIDLGKVAEKMDSVRDMLDVALGGEMGKKTAAQFRGITPARVQPLMYLKELLDDDTDLSAFAHSLAKDLPHHLAAQHPAGALSPSQL